MSKKNILYVDDVNYSLVTIQTRLKNHYQIHPANSSKEMYEILSTTLPDLILLDINMPEVGGFEILKMLKANPRYSKVPVVFITAKGKKSDLLEGMELGAADFMLKSFTDEQMVSCIEHCINPQMDKPVVLAVDDNPSILKTVNFLLNKDYVVRTLSDSAKMRELLHIIKPDLFLLDYNMPGLTGFDLVPRIREFPEHTDTPIVFLTSEGSVDNLSSALYLGAKSFIVKPINDADFRKKIAASLSSYLYVRRLRALANGDYL
ncbi:MAG: response regulator [Defluviitaleaceae bacterium]|nr:response regulator [Defluviitaleaceae bacterium]MCL2263457.1 response regulator [Defluviitaleaceae bacterium]